MRKIYSILVSALLLMPNALKAQSFVNITPRPNSLTVHNGRYTLPRQFSVNIKNVNDSNKVEVERFVQKFTASTGDKVTLVKTDAPAVMTINREVQSNNPEAYQLTITAEGITIGAKTNAGLFYAFRSLEHLFPAEVRAGIQHTLSSDIVLPELTISDAPRFGYRGFMLDVSRHFFDVNEIKKLIDLMADYKMNRFHWHLSDDQGFRVESKKYPRLNTIGSIAPNCYANSLEYGSYWTNKQYGPFYYTQDEIRDVVAYAKERHIEIIPEIDMPGHFTAAMVAYPEFSCRPNAERSVWISGGISHDVLNVANPKAVQFAKDILTEIMDLFPYSQVHIGGDECPTDWWETNADCQQMYARLGLKNYRELQSHFMKEMAEHITAHGHKTSVWNESITAEGADVDLIKQAGATVYCWVNPVPAARKAASLGLNNIVTPWGPYYINRKQSNDPIKPSAPGNGSDANLSATYNFVPVPADIPQEQQKYYTGVQATFWTEHVADTAYLEYLALPRLFAVAEAGWTQQNLKDYNQFVHRIAADTTYLNLKKFNYYRNVLRATPTAEKVYPQVSTTSKRYYYQLRTNAGDASRKGRYMEVLSATSPLVRQWAKKGAKEGVLWTSPMAESGAENYDAQLWCLEESEANPGRYALVCKAYEQGSVNPTPTAKGVSGRWSYDKTQKHYDFVLGDRSYGQKDNVYYYSIRSQQISNLYLNASLGGQGLAVNLYGNPDDGQAGQWSFMLKEQPAGEADVQEAMSEAKELIGYAQTYSADKEVGKFGAQQKANLQQALEAVEQPNVGTPEDYKAKVKALKDALQKMYDSFGYVENKESYYIANTVDGYSPLFIADGIHTNGVLGYTDVPDTTKNIFQVVGVQNMNKLTQEVRLKNKETKQYVSGTEEQAIPYIGLPVKLSRRMSWIKVRFDLKNQDFEISFNGNDFYPISTTSVASPGVIAAGAWLGNHLMKPVRPQGNGWMFIKYDKNKPLSIQQLQTNEQGGIYYDLLGRPVQNPYEGVFIHNGKKVLK